MFLRGINYDIGTFFTEGKLSRQEFDEKIIKKEIEIIKNDLNCDSIRISGFDVNRLSIVSEFALNAGLQVWFSPAYIDAFQEQAVEYLKECAKAAEKLRQKNGNLIFIAGCENTIYLKGFVDGETTYERIRKKFSPPSIILNVLGLKNNVYKKLNSHLKEVVENVRQNFGGKLTYASGTWENVDWSLFDIVGIDHYRASYNKSNYIKQLSAYYKFNKPVAVLEFGTCAYIGAGDKGGAAWAITEIKDGKLVIKGNHNRDESVQSKYIVELLDIFKKENVYAAFVFTFINPRFMYNDIPKFDLDLASYGIVKSVNEAGESTYKGLPWIPKEAFFSLADYYGDRN